MDEWRHIDTAPRDGVSILARNDEHEGHTAQVVFFWEGAWRVDDGTGCMVYSHGRPMVAFPPTHWMPLPDENM